MKKQLKTIMSASPASRIDSAPYRLKPPATIRVPFGTFLLPALLLLIRAPFLFGYAKPVPVQFRSLRRPRRDMVWVASAGPGMNLLLATIPALLFHVVGYVPAEAGPWIAQNLVNAININVILAVFNMIPLPPLEAGSP